MALEAPHRSLIKEFEALRLKPYLCSAGVPTNGWGTTRYPGGAAVTLKDPAITVEQASAYFDYDLRRFESGVKALLKRATPAHEFSALVSFAYNMGLGALERSTLLKLHNAGISPSKVAEEFPKWRFEKANGTPKPSWGLLRRRLSEAHMYLGGGINTDWNRDDYRKLL